MKSILGMIRMRCVLAAILLGSVMMVSCDETNEDVSSSAQTGVFSISGEIGIHYYDADGKDIVKYDDKSTWPVMAMSEISADSIQKLQNDSSLLAENMISYGKGKNIISRKTVGGVCLYEPQVWGDGNSSCNTYIHVGDAVDKITTTYTYILMDGNWYPQKQSITYNGQLVWTRDVRYSEVAVTRTQGTSTVRIVSQTK